jgi:hypothetical protein
MLKKRESDSATFHTQWSWVLILKLLIKRTLKGKIHEIFHLKSLEIILVFIHYNYLTLKQETTCPRINWVHKSQKKFKK